MIQTDRLTLRRFRADDLEPLHQIFTHPDVMRYWVRPPHETIEDTQQVLAGFMRDRAEDHLEYAVECDGVFIGRVAIWRPYEIGFLFNPDHWGKGYAFEAASALVDEVRNRFPKAVEITAEIDPRNQASAQLLLKLGFEMTHMKKQNFLYGGTEWTDTAYFSLPLRKP